MKIPKHDKIWVSLGFGKDNRMKIRTLEIQPVILRKILVNAISEGGEGLMDVDSDYLDEDAVNNLVDGIMEEVENIGWERNIEV